MIKALVEHIVTPPIAMMFEKLDFPSLSIDLRQGEGCKGTGSSKECEVKPVKIMIGIVMAYIVMAYIVMANI